MVSKLLRILRQLKNYRYLLLIVLLLSFYLRFWQLGYSGFYGDETKALYTDKTVPAIKFLLDQRKGPVQFVAAWGMEKLSGGYDELAIRIPFALAGSLSVLVLFLIVNKIAGRKAALISAGLYGFNGFFIAFSRTVQYQSFLLLFGFLAIYFALLYEEIKIGTGKRYAALSGIFLALAYLSHYDAVFFDLAVAIILVRKIIFNRGNLKGIIKEISIYYLPPFVFTAGLFYVPYFVYGYYYSNTFNYLNRRLTGLEFGQNASWYTFWVYNPHLIWAFLTVFIIPFLLKQANWHRHLLLFWFLVPFVVFEFIFSNPGTHIHNYFIPLIVMISIGIVDLLEFMGSNYIRQAVYIGLVCVFLTLFSVAVFVYVPGANRGYPWKDSNLGSTEASRISKNFHLFLYGFPYERGWTQIARYVEEKGGIRGYYTNDNVVVAQYYLRGIDLTKPGVNFLPDHFIYVYDNQEFVDLPKDMLVELDKTPFTDVYDLEKEFYVDGQLTASMFKNILPKVK